MQHDKNQLDQPIGLPVFDWKPPRPPARETIEGRFCYLEPLDLERHAAVLDAANGLDAEGRIWTYLPYGPFDTFDGYRAWMEQTCLGSDPLFYTIVDRATDSASGVASYLRIDPANGSIEVGHINYAPPLQRTPAATEAMYLMMRQVFELGFRRYEWKCNALNAPSRAAARRLGFSFEGVFRQAAVVKGRNRDTAWYALIDKDWPALEDAFQRWLDASNFDAHGRQGTRLSALTAPVLREPARDDAERVDV
jgi:RimJ/RimL family protein N-acetyltransferase